MTSPARLVASSRLLDEGEAHTSVPRLVRAHDRAQHPQTTRCTVSRAARNAQRRGCGEGQCWLVVFLRCHFHEVGRQALTEWQAAQWHDEPQDPEQRQPIVLGAGWYGTACPPASTHARAAPSRRISHCHMLRQPAALHQQAEHNGKPCWPCAVVDTAVSAAAKSPDPGIRPAIMRRPRARRAVRPVERCAGALERAAKAQAYFLVLLEDAQHIAHGLRSAVAEQGHEAARRPCSRCARMAGCRGAGSLDPIGVARLCGAGRARARGRNEIAQFQSVQCCAPPVSYCAACWQAKCTKWMPAARSSINRTVSFFADARRHHAQEDLLRWNCHSGCSSATASAARPAHAPLSMVACRTRGTAPASRPANGPSTSVRTSAPAPRNRRVGAPRAHVRRASAWTGRDHLAVIRRQRADGLPVPVPEHAASAMDGAREQLEAAIAVLDDEGCQLRPESRRPLLPTAALLIPSRVDMVRIAALIVRTNARMHRRGRKVPKSCTSKPTLLARFCRYW